MANFESMYFSMFNSVTDAHRIAEEMLKTELSIPGSDKNRMNSLKEIIMILEQAQCEGEDAYIEAE